MTVRRTLKELRAPNELDRALGGERALQFLRNPDNLRPGLILPDLNMPRMNGIDFVAEIKKDPELRVIPVVVSIIQPRWQLHGGVRQLAGRLHGQADRLPAVRQQHEPDPRLLDNQRHAAMTTPALSGATSPISVLFSDDDLVD